MYKGKTILIPVIKNLLQMLLNTNITVDVIYLMENIYQEFKKMDEIHIRATV